MKRLFLAAALAAAAVPAAQAGAIPPDTAGGPLGAGGACMAVGGTPAPGVCRFLASSDTVGSGGIAGPGGSITLTHKEKTASCVNNVWVHTTTTKTDESVTGPNYLGSMDSYIAGVVYTLTVSGPGWAVAGGPSDPAPAAPAEPADSARDLTGGHAAGSAC